MRIFIMNFEDRQAWEIPNAEPAHVERTSSPISIGLVFERHVTNEELVEWLASGYAKPCDYSYACNADNNWGPK